MAPIRFTRRTLLQQLAAIPITASLARTLYAQTAAGGATPPKRLVIFMQNNGTKRNDFWPARPSAAAAAYPLTNPPILNALFTNDGKTDNGLKAKTNLIRGLHVTNDGVGTTADQIATSARIRTINQFYADLVRKLAVDLASTPEGSGNMLDHTLIVWASEMGRGDHQLTDIPVALIGLVGNGIKAGGRVLDVAAERGAQQPHNLLGYHVLNALGHATPGFGDIADMSAYAIAAL